MNKEAELVDLVDASGQTRVRGVPRPDINQFPDLHMQIVIAVIFNRKGEILVQQRAKTKSTNPGDIDHICGGVKSGETPEEAVIRESEEEAGGIRPQSLSIILKGVNQYGRYRYLLMGEADGEPGPVDPQEVEWACFMSPDMLKEKYTSGDFTFVRGFFKETELAIAARSKKTEKEGSGIFTFP